MNKLFLFMIPLAILFSCSQGPVTGGGSGTETTNSFVVLASGRPASYCRVRLIDSREWVESRGAGVFDSTITAEDGSFSFRFKQVDYSSFNLQIDHDSAGAIIRNVTAQTLDSSTYTLQKYSTISGTVSGQTGNTSLLFQGTTYRAQIDTSGSFSTKIPEGLYSMYIARSTGLQSAGFITIPTDSQISITVPQYSQSEFLFTDFQCGYQIPFMENIGIPIFWYLFSDSTSKAYNYNTHTWEIRNSADFIKQGNSFVSSNISTSRNDQTLDLSVQFDPFFASAYGGLGIVFYRENNSGIDLSSVDSIRFDAWGQGTCKFNVFSVHPIYKQIVRFSSTFTLSNLPASLSIRLNDLEIDANTADSLKMPWSEASKTISLIEFAFDKMHNEFLLSTEMSLDNIVFKGCSVEEFTQRN